MCCQVSTDFWQKTHRRKAAANAYGYKRHLLSDAQTLTDRAVGVTPANVPEVTV